MTTCNVSNHHSAAVATETVLKQPRQFTVTIWNVVLLMFRVIFVKGVNAVTKCQQRSVNVCALNHPHPPIVSL